VVAKITVVEGDCSIDDLGIHVDDWNELCKHVTIIYHFAATTRFDAELKPATELNLCGTREMIKLARECKQLTLFCYISTAYCHLSEQYLEEKAYDPPYDPYMFMEEVSKMTVSEAEVFMKDFPREVYPNTYVLTKALSETLVLDALENHKLPVMILRPSVVTSTIETPVKGWCPNYNGLGGLLIAIGKGVIRTAHCNKKYYFDFLPVDIATGGLMIATWNYLALK
jgi:fatty acyl-CoA reductase